MDGIELINVCKTYASVDKKIFSALKEINIRIASGEFVSVIGESGSGKSTLARMVLGLEKPSAGSVTIDQTDWHTLKAREKRRLRCKIQAVFQDSTGTLNPCLSVYANVEESLCNLTTLSSRARRQRIMGLMALTHMNPKLLSIPTRQLSGGQQRRLSLLRALSVRPKYLVLDEVLSGLDLISADAVMRVLEDYNRKYHCACVLVTHDLSAARRLSDRILMMREGRIVGIGEPTD